MPKTMLTLQEFSAEVERQNDAKVDYIAPAALLTMLTPAGDGPPPGDVPFASELHFADVGEFTVLDHAHGQIANRLKIPKTFYDRLRAAHPGLLDVNVNTLLRKADEPRMLRTLDGRLRAYLSDGYRRLDNYELVERAILPVLGAIPDVRVESLALTDRRLYVKAVAPRIEGEVKVGQIVQAGVSVSNSEVGSGSLKVEPWVYVLECLNGMVAEQTLTRRHVGRHAEGDEAHRVFSDETLRKDDDALFAKVGDVMRAAVDETAFQAMLVSMREAAGTRAMTDPVESVQRLANRYQLNEGEHHGVLRHLTEGGDLSKWGAINAVTRTSQDVESYDRAHELEATGGQMLAMTDREWQSIALVG